MNNQDKLVEATMNALQNRFTESDDSRGKVINQQVELNGVRWELSYQSELDCFNAMKNKIVGLEQYVSNFRVDFMGGKSAYIEFVSKDGEGQFIVYFDTESFGNVTHVQTTFSNQEVTSDSVSLASELIKLK